MSSLLPSSSFRSNEKSIIFVVNNITRLKSLRSQPVIVDNLPWQIEIEHREHSGKIGGDNALAIRLHSLNVDHSNWSCAAMATIELKTFDANRQPLTNVIGPWVFNNRELSWSRNRFILWTDLFDGNAGYVRGGRIRLHITILAQKLPTTNYRAVYQHILNVHQIYFRIENIRGLLCGRFHSFCF